LKLYFKRTLFQQQNAILINIHIQVYTFDTLVGNKGNAKSALALDHRTMDKGKCKINGVICG